MKNQRHLINLLGRSFFALLAGIIFIPQLHAQYEQPTSQRIDNRYLLIFDTSSAMKKRLPATEKAVRELFAITLNGQFKAGDTIGVWTFSKDLRTGQLPLEHWEPQDVMSFPMEVLDFVKNQHYSKTTSYDTMVEMLNRVVRHSPRLTTVIICDGNGTIKGMPYDDAINSIFKQNQAAMQKAEEPFIVIIRSQFGKYAGYTVNVVSGIGLPQFPPLPRPVEAEPAKPALPPSPPPQPGPPPPPLIIVGTRVGTNLPAPAPMPAPAAPVNPVPPPSPAPQSNPAVPSSPAPHLSENPAPETNTISSMPTNLVVAATPVATPPPTAPAPVASTQPDSSTSGKGRLFTVGACVLALAGVGAFVVFRSRSHRESASLITESLKKR